MKTADLQGVMLDYWVARAECLFVDGIRGRQLIIGATPDRCVYSPSTNWAQGGPLIEKYRMYVDGGDLSCWGARTGPDNMAAGSEYGDTTLVAICRAVVRSVFGDEVEDVCN